MQNGFKKGLKPQYIKQLALLMSICYLLNPLQHQINTVLHELSHGLEMPSSLLSHETPLDTSSKVHESHDHSEHVDEHEHLIVGFLNTIFEASNQDDASGNSQLVEIKWDKHITSYQFTLTPNFKNKIEKHFFPSKEKLKLGHSKKLEEPPQTSPS